jgi:two-component system, NarL family, sensor kinase
VSAREEERRRIRRDLHDGLGPTLASVCLGLGAAVERIGDDAPLGALLTQLEDELHAAVDGIRQLVYDLRPPALDELGLVGAVRQHVATLNSIWSESTPTPELHVECEDVTGELPAAVEVAAYRIALEAITNVTRHAGAAHCWVRFTGSSDTLHLEIDDDGRGIDVDRRVGVGFRSMYERAAELGGELVVRPRSPKGTSVLASLPLAVPAGRFAT